MAALPKSLLLRFVERTVVLAHRAVSRFSTWYSRKRFTLRQHVVRLRLKVKKTTTYRDLVDELTEMPRIRDTFTPLHEAWNARLDTGLYHQRNANETVNAAVEQKFGAFGRVSGGSSSMNSWSNASVTPSKRYSPDTHGQCRTTMTLAGAVWWI